MKKFNFLLIVLPCLLVALSFGPFRHLSARVTTPAQDDQFQLALILKAGREYCRRLGNAAMDFVCLEEVSEKADLSRESPQSIVSEMPGPGAVGVRNPRNFRYDRVQKIKRENTYLFDYQFVRKDGQIKENRALLKMNGKSVRNKKSAPATEAFKYEDILFAPVRLLDERFRDYYSFRLLGEEDHDGVRAWVIEVSPRLAFVESYLGGKVRLKQDDYSLLRIDWDPMTFGGFENILLRAKSYDSEPQVTSYTDFGFERNGIRFPSLDLTEEAYVSKDGVKFVRATTKVIYRDYKFFTVETETEIKK